MYKYQFSSGEYSDFCASHIYHEKLFTTREFLTMYNQVIDTLKKERVYCNVDDIAEKMCELFGFLPLDIVCGVHIGYENFKKVPTDFCEKNDCTIVDIDDL